MATLEEEIKNRLSKALERHHLSIVEAARRLGVSRQSLHAYLSGSACPSVEVLYRACALWGIVISYGGYKFGVRAKERRKRQAQGSGAQLEIPFTLENLKSRDIQVKVGKKTARSAEVQLSISISASSREL
jgi:transcriptional regulator with XRE-family HTH domain